MATSRPIQGGEWLLSLRGVATQKIATGQEAPENFVLQEDFGIHRMDDDPFWLRAGERVFAVPGVRVGSDPHLAAAITNGTAPGLYVREGDDTSDWETYRQVLARRVEEAMAARRGGEVGLSEVTTTRAMPMATTRQVDEMCPPSGGIAAIADVRKVSSPSPPITVALNVSPMSEQEAARIATAVTDGVRRSLSSPLASNSDETTRRRVVTPVPPAVSVSLRPHDSTAAAITDYLQSLGATHVHVRQETGSLPVVEVTGLSQQAFDTARQNLPVGVQLRAAGDVVGRRENGETTAARGGQGETSAAPTPSRFSLLEVDDDPSTDAASPSPPQALKASVDLAALQQELRAEREAKRALAAAQTPPGRFDLLECDLPAVVVKTSTKTTKTPQTRPAASPPPKSHNPVETITDLTTARSPLELARMLEGLNDELSTMMRQREAN